MDIIRRRIGGQAREFKVYTQDEADRLGLEYVPWKQAEAGQWALSDDGYAAECLISKAYSGRDGQLSRNVKLPFGTQWVTRYGKLEYLPHKASESFTHTSTRSWRAKEERRRWLQNAVKVRAAQELGKQRRNWKEVSKAYSPDAPIPIEKVKRLFRYNRVKEMVRREIEAEIVGDGMNVFKILELGKEILAKAEAKGDVSEMRRIWEIYGDILGVSPPKPRTRARGLGAITRGRL